MDHAQLIVSLLRQLPDRDRPWKLPGSIQIYETCEVGKIFEEAGGRIAWMAYAITACYAHRANRRVKARVCRQILEEIKRLGHESQRQVAAGIRSGVAENLAGYYEMHLRKSVQRQHRKNRTTCKTITNSETDKSLSIRHTRQDNDSIVNFSSATRVIEQAVEHPQTSYECQRLVPGVNHPGVIHANPDDNEANESLFVDNCIFPSSGIICELSSATDSYETSHDNLSSFADGTGGETMQDFVAASKKPGSHICQPTFAFNATPSRSIEQADMWCNMPFLPESLHFLTGLATSTSPAPMSTMQKLLAHGQKVMSPAITTGVSEDFGELFGAPQEALSFLPDCLRQVIDKWAPGSQMAKVHMTRPMKNNGGPGLACHYSLTFTITEKHASEIAGRLFDAEIRNSGEARHIYKGGLKCSSRSDLVLQGTVIDPAILIQVLGPELYGGMCSAAIMDQMCLPGLQDLSDYLIMTVPGISTEGVTLTVMIDIKTGSLLQSSLFSCLP